MADLLPKERPIRLELLLSDEEAVQLDVLARREGLKARGVFLRVLLKRAWNDYERENG